MIDLLDTMFNKSSKMFAQKHIESIECTKLINMQLLLLSSDVVIFSQASCAPSMFQFKHLIISAENVIKEWEVGALKQTKLILVTARFDDYLTKSF